MIDPLQDPAARWDRADVEKLNRVAAQQAFARQRRAAFIEDYTDMRSWGLSHQQIADRLGVTREALMRRCARNDVYIPEDHERALMEAIDRLAASGVEFTSVDLPSSSAMEISGALKRAQRIGLIEAVGWTYIAGRGVVRQRLWQSTAAKSVAS